MANSNQDHLSLILLKHPVTSDDKDNILHRIFGSQLSEKPKDELVAMILRLIEDCRRLEVDNEQLRSKLAEVTTETPEVKRDEHFPPSQDQVSEGGIRQPLATAADPPLDHAPRNITIPCKQEDALPGTKCNLDEEIPKTNATEVYGREPWRCDGCDTTNDSSRLQCATCDQPRYSPHLKSSESNELVQCKECGVVSNRGDHCPICQSGTRSISSDPKCDQTSAMDLEEKDDAPLATDNQERAIPHCVTQQQAAEMVSQVGAGKSEYGAAPNNFLHIIQQTWENVEKKMETEEEREIQNSIKKVEEAQANNQSECGQTSVQQQKLCRQCGVVTVLVDEKEDALMTKFDEYMRSLKAQFTFGGGKTTAELNQNFTESLCQHCIEHMHSWIGLNRGTADIQRVLDFVVVLNEAGGHHCHRCMLQVVPAFDALCAVCSALELHRAEEHEAQNSVKKFEETQANSQSKCRKASGQQQTLCRQCGVVTVLVGEKDGALMTKFDEYMRLLKAQFTFGGGKTTAELIRNFAESLCQHCIQHIFSWIGLNHGTADIQSVLDFIVVLNEAGGRHCHQCMLQVVPAYDALCALCSALELLTKAKVQDQLSIAQSHGLVVSTASMQFEAGGYQQEFPPPSSGGQHPSQDKQSLSERESKPTIASGLPVGRGRGLLNRQKMDAPGSNVSIGSVRGTQHSTQQCGERNQQLASVGAKVNNQVVGVSAAGGDAEHAHLSRGVCTKCGLRNDRQDGVCQKCLGKRTDVAADGTPNQRVDTKHSENLTVWTCASCTCENEWKDKVCAACAKSREFNQETAGDSVQDDKNSWECSVCTIRNEMRKSFCSTCSATKFGISRSLNAGGWQWKCPYCTNENSIAYKYCSSCFSKFKHRVCGICGYQNNLTVQACGRCHQSFLYWTSMQTSSV